MNHIITTDKVSVLDFNEQLGIQNNTYEGIKKTILEDEELAHAQDDANGNFKAGDEDQGRYAENYGEDFADYAGFASETFGAGELADGNNRNLGNTEEERARNTALLEQNNQTYSNTNKQRGDDAIDTIWDIANIAYDLGKAGYALTKGDEALLEEALKDLAADTVAALIPGLPAGTSKLAKIAAKKLKDGKKLTKKESEALSQAVEAKKAQRQGGAQTPSTSGTSKSGGSGSARVNLEKPKGIPDTWHSKPSRKGGGTSYVNPNNPHDRVRVMPGKPHSPNPAQRKPYVIRTLNGKALDANGKPVPTDSPAAHIPFDKFKF